MESTKEMKQFLSNTIIINSIVWAAVMLVSYFILGEAYKKISFILLIGFFIEFLRYNSTKNKLDKTTSKKD
ncbi:MAG: preprotein translocase subunit SecF [Polaribacter sp.]|jgi:preprotein translocase subunit SecF